MVVETKDHSSIIWLRRLLIRTIEQMAGKPSYISEWSFRRKNSHKNTVTKMSIELIYTDFNRVFFNTLKFILNMY